MILIVLLVFLFCGSYSCSVKNRTEDRLVFAHIIFRHGERTIIHPYPNDPYKGKEHWPEGFAQLTNRGKQQEYKLGKFLRRRYLEKLLGDGKYSPDKIYTLSSERDRTINSAALVLSGLFPPKDDQIWNENLLWQPIPVFVIPEKTDYLIINEGACDRLEQAIEEFEQTPEIQALYDRNKALFEYVEKHAGTPIRGVMHAKNLHNTLDVEYHSNKTLPEWAQTIYAPDSQMEWFGDYYMKFTSETTEMKKLKSGFLLKEILNRFQKKSEGNLQPDRSLWLYSGHDTTIGAMLNSLGLFETLHIPPHSSSLIFELYQSNESFYLRIFYRNSTTDDPQPLNIPNCGTKCPLDEFYYIYRDILPTSDFETECGFNSLN